MHNFSDEQIEAAAEVLAVYEWVSWAVVPDHIKVRYRAQARAALVAAQGAAPQAEGEYGDRYTCADLGHEDCGLDNHITAPVQPSSTVDEDALAEVIQAAEYDYRNAEFIGDPDIGTLAQYQARAVAVWLKGQGNAARE